jgi:hypothetical protein
MNEHPMSTRRPTLLIAASILLLVLAAAITWLLTHGAAGGYRAKKPMTASNPALNVRFTYDASVFKPAPYDGRAEFPLRLDADTFSFYGKRIRGIGTFLAREPGPMLYDFVGTQHEDVFTYYRLEPVGETRYEDADLGGELGLHTTATYRQVDASIGLPGYFPAAVQEGSEFTVESWARFSDNDLFYFYAISAAPLGSGERAACDAVIDTLRFDALAADDLAPSEPAPTVEDKEADDGALKTPAPAEGE